MPNGVIQPEFSSRLDSVGKWLSKYGNTVYSTKGSTLKKQNWGVITEKGNEYYLHLFDSATNTIIIDSFLQKPGKLFTFKDNTPLNYQYKNGILSVDVSNLKRDEFDTVLKLYIK